MHILLRGLKFTPTPDNRNVQEIRTDILEFNRKIRLKEHFHDENYEQDVSIVSNKVTLNLEKVETNHLKIT